jgi:hypothetical protein
MTENAGVDAGGARCAGTSRAARQQSLFPVLVSVPGVACSSPEGVAPECSSRAGSAPISRFRGDGHASQRGSRSARGSIPQDFLHEVTT